MNPPHDMSSPRGRADEYADVERTLRLMASVPAPEGIESRVKARLGEASRAVERSGLLAFLPVPGEWLHSQWSRGFAAAAIVAIVAGSGWGVFSRVEPAQVENVMPVPQMHASGGFSTAGAMRTPQTLQGPVLSRPAAKPVKPGDQEAKGTSFKTPKMDETVEDGRQGTKKQDRLHREGPARTTENARQ